MFNDIQAVLEGQHRLLNSLLIEALREGMVDHSAWAAFKETLLRHISIEERVLLKWLRDAGVEFSLAGRLHEDHRRIGEMLNEEPTVELVKKLSRFITDHEALEESDIGLFVVCAQTLDEEALIRAVQEYPPMRGGYSKDKWLPTTREQAFDLAGKRSGGQE